MKNKNTLCLYFCEGEDDLQLINALEKHKIDVSRLWTTQTSDSFSFAKRNSHEIK